MKGKIKFTEARNEKTIYLIKRDRFRLFLPVIIGCTKITGKKERSVYQQSK